MENDKSKKQYDPVLLPIFVLAIGYILVAIFFTSVLNFNFLQSDVLGYWQDSLEWRTPFDKFHVPGYPLMVALLRGITFNALPPITIMWIINFSAFLVSIYLIFKIVQTATINTTVSTLASLLFGLWPLVGLTYTVDPLADIPAMCMLLIGIYFLQKSKMGLSGIFLGLAMITHKTMWIFVFFIIVLQLISHKEFFSKRNMILLLAAILPLGILWILGSIYHQSITWIISSNLNAEIASRSSLPIFDGIIGAFFEGGIKGILKGSVVILLFILNIYLLVVSIKIPNDSSSFIVAISLSTLLLFVFTNRMEIWASVRYSRLLVLPFATALSSLLKDKVDWEKYRVLIIVILLLLFLSQFVYAWYAARVFFA